MNYYSYEELAAKALAPNAAQADIDELGEWFQQYGMMYWNGQCFNIDKTHDLYPVYEENEDGDIDIVCYEVR